MQIKDLAPNPENSRTASSKKLATLKKAKTATPPESRHA